MSGESMNNLVSTQWLADELGAEDLRLFDASVLFGPDEEGNFRIASGADKWSAEHIAGSGHIDLVSEISDPESSLMFTAPTPEALAKAFAARGVGDHTRVVIYDDSMNMWATRVWWLLRSVGFDNVAILDGGLSAWKSDGRELTSGPAPSYPAGQLSVKPRPGTFVDTAFVEDAIAGGSSCLVNALSEANHSGEDDRYGKPGHLPGATNVSAQGLVDPVTHRYLPLVELESVFESAGVGDSPVITYCGGGIAATSDAFVLHLLGHEDISVYDGSLTDWINQGLPLET